MNSPRVIKQRHQGGVSLIEVLVAILVIALGILTMLAMQINSTKLTKSSEIRAMGAMLVSDLADRMRANRAGFDTGNYTFQETTKAPQAITTCTNDNANCTPAQMAQQDLGDWLTTIRFSLPTGTARISAVDNADGKSGVDVWLIWLDPEENSGANSPSPAACPNDLDKDVAAAKTSAAVRCMYFRINV